MLLRRALNPRLAAQALVIKVSANLVVQFTALHSDPTKLSLDWQQVAEFALYGSLGSQVGNIIQFILEDWFPTRNAPVGDVLPTAQPEPAPLEEKLKLDEPVSPHPDNEARRRCPSVVGPDVSWRNVVAKTVIDQTIGLLISGTIFLTCTNFARVSSFAQLLAIIRERIWPLIRAGWHIWPLIAVCNFLWVPVRSRVLVAVIVGFGWSIFLSIFANRK
ncbi:hypothetical protein B0I35DRAFT_361983 [Stachybotrys elegans]|uniref:Uncharacterized protein n=1 Tax=Stachybotrys elegans TaxID=80388 RepID=A0A8K0SBI5_9HYPO|nr:hypothetical protein B0I35DRAFT_361983 [Stachybotrys elegans]